jgi:hypothetical protein
MTNAPPRAHNARDPRPDVDAAARSIARTLYSPEPGTHQEQIA